MKTNKLKVAVPLIILCVATIAYAAHVDFGTLSTFGWSTVSLICPLGALSTMLAAKSVILRVVVVLIIVAMLAIVFGRAFCGWVCPVPIISKLRDVFGAKQVNKDDARLSQAGEDKIDKLAKTGADDVPREAAGGGIPRDAAEAAETGTLFATTTPLSEEEMETLKGGCSSCNRKRGNVLDSRHLILGGSVLTAAIFGFPVFCLVCPIGLTFATIFLVFNLFSAGDMTWSVVVVPLLLLVEVVFFRKWCSTFCPLSALLSLANKAGRFFRPTIDNGKCIESSHGLACGVCSAVCPEKIDPRHPDASPTSMSECTKCRACLENCPAGAIRLAAWAPKPSEPQYQVASKAVKSAEALEPRGSTATVEPIGEAEAVDKYNLNETIESTTTTDSAKATDRLGLS